MRCRFHHASVVGLVLFAFALGNTVDAAPLFASVTLVAETVQNGQIDYNEGIGLSVCIRNPDGAPTPHLIGRIGPAAGGFPWPARSYGSLAPHETACRTHTLQVPVQCGTGLHFVLRVDNSDGSVNGFVNFSLAVGAPGMTEGFDSVVAPAVPNGWAATLATGPPSVAAWATRADSTHLPPNWIFAPAPAAATDNRLTSPSFTLPAGASRLSFYHQFGLETGYDGGVLEIAVGEGAFTDILAAGGTFVTGGGYSGTLSPNTHNPLAGRNAWTGSGGGDTVVNMPAAAAGQSIRLRWRLGTDNLKAGTGWAIDEVIVVGTSCAGVPNTVPWGLQGVANGNLVTFSWQEPNAPILGYVLEASVDGGLTFPFTVPTGLQTSFTAMAPDVAVVARVRATLPGSTTSGPSNTAAVAIGSAAAPGRISNLLSSVDGASMTLAWSLPLTGGTISSVLLEAGSSPGLSNLATLPLAPGSTGFTAPGLPPGTYFIRMRAVGRALAGQASHEVTVTVPGVCTPPATPILLKAEKSAGSVTISWELPPLGTSAHSQFVLEAGSAPGGADLAIVPTSARSLTATAPPGNYHVRVFARNSCGASAKTADASFTIP